MGDRYVVPRLLSRAPTMWLSVAAAVLGLVGVSAYYLTQPDTRVAVVVVDLLLIVVFAALLSRRVVVDRAEGTVTREMLWVLRRTASWDQAKLQTVQTGQRLLSVGAAHIPIAADDMGGRRVQPPEVITLLADQVEQWAPQKVAVARELRALASHDA